MRKRLHLYAMKLFPGTITKYSGIVLLFASLAVLLVPKLFQEGLFMDGCIYGSVARNLSEGSGNFWQLYFSETLLNPFHEHPPLAFALQSLVFRVFGDQFFVERFYQLLIAIISTLLIIGIYKQHSKNFKLQWLAALLWLTTERVFWSANENMLESTMSVFDLLSVYFLGRSILSVSKKSLLNIFVAAIALYCAFLSKGLPALFPFAYFAFAFLSKQLSFAQMFKKSIYLVFSVALICAVIIVFSDEAYQSLRTYLQQQVLGSVQGKDRVGLRLPFISGFFQQIILYFILVAVALFIHYKTKSKLKVNTSTRLFLLLGLSAFLPLLVSPKLSFYYLVPCFPYFAIATVLFIEPIFIEKTSLPVQNILQRVALVISSLAIVVTLYLSMSWYGTAGRDADLIAEIKSLKSTCPAHTVISVSENLQEDWTTFAYLQRIAKVAVKKGEADELFVLAEQSESTPEGYNLLRKEEGKRFVIYSKNSSHKKRAN